LKEATMGDREGADQTGGAKTTPRQEEATTSETLDDLNSTQTGTTSQTSGGASNEDSKSGDSAPSPDGAFDSGRGGRADGSDAGEPM
jgi:hypothetical protein